MSRRAAQLHTQGGVLPRRQGKGAVILGGKSAALQPQPDGLRAVGLAQGCLRGVLQPGQVGAQNSGCRLGIGCVCQRRGQGIQHGVPHLQFQQLVGHGIAVCQNMQPHGVAADLLRRKRAPQRRQNGKYKRRRQNPVCP